jgi:hypothetical protein
MGEPGGRPQETKKRGFPNTLPVISCGHARVVSSSAEGFRRSNGPQLSSEKLIYTGNRPDMSARGEGPGLSSIYFVTYISSMLSLYSRNILGSS